MQEEDGEDYCNPGQRFSQADKSPLSKKMCFENVLLIFDTCTAKQLQDTHEWVI